MCFFFWWRYSATFLSISFFSVWKSFSHNDTSWKKIVKRIDDRHHSYCCCCCCGCCVAVLVGGGFSYQLYSVFRWNETRAVFCIMYKSNWFIRTASTNCMIFCGAGPKSNIYGWFRTQSLVNFSVGDGLPADIYMF